MGLTWRDLVSSVTIVVMVLAYASFVYGTRLLLLANAWTTSAVELLLGFICAVSAAADLHTTPQQRHGVIFRKITTVLGAIAFLAGMTGVVTNSAHAVEVLVVTTAFLWLTATLWHVLAIGGRL